MSGERVGVSKDSPFVCEDRIGCRKWARRNGRLADIHSLDDRYDHDVDELMS